VSGAKASRPGPELSGQAVLVLGGSAGIGLATARHARAQSADVILVARNAERLRQAAEGVGSRQSAAFDGGDRDALQEFFASLPGPVTHVMVNAGWPFYGPVLDLTYEEARTAISYHPLQAVEVARNARDKMPPG
jgi:NAD(P)-dependent dehydrogenase (short-subunit alcohol dehydrogenase family)